MVEWIASRDDGYLTSAETGWPRVSQRVYKGIFITFLPIITLGVLSRLAIKLRQHRRLEADDLFLVLALACSVAAWVLVWLMRDLIYLEMELVLGMTEFTLASIESMVLFSRLYNSSMVLTWMAVYAVKMSFMFFFRKLIARVRFLEVYWWWIMAVLVPAGLFSAFFSFWICPDLTIEYFSLCSVNSMMFREEIYVYTTTALDIFTDLLIISLPIMLLYKVRISLRRKIILGMALCLSIFMIAICIVRITTCKLPNGIIDSTWLALWQCIETNTAILMVSLTAFRSLYRQGVSPSYATPQRSSRSILSLVSFWPSSLRRFKLSSGRNTNSSGVRQDQELKVQLDDGVLPERPRRAVPFIRRGHTQEEIDCYLLPSLDLSSKPQDTTMISHVDPYIYQLYRWPVRSPSRPEGQFQTIDEERGERGTLPPKSDRGSQGV